MMNETGIIDRIKAWFFEPIMIMKLELKRIFWLLVIGGLFLSLVVLVVVTGYLGLEHLFPVYVFLICLFLIAGIIIFVKTVKVVFSIYIVFAVILSAVSFALEKFLFDNEAIFPPFTLRTVICLWISFIFLLISMFYQKLPKRLLFGLGPLLLFGGIVCIPFIVYMAPFMLFSWVLIPFFGLGMLPYSPLIAGIAFMIAFIKVQRRIIRDFEKPVVRGYTLVLIGGCLIFSGYVGWYIYQWSGAMNSITTQTEYSPGHNQVYKDLPVWAKVGMKMPVNHATDLFLRSYGSDTFFGFGPTGYFDFISFIPGCFMHTDSLREKDNDKLLTLLFNRSHVGLDRLWRGDTLRTTSVDHHIQVYPESRLVYTEVVFTIKNDDNDRQQEAIYTLTLPPDSVASALSLWIDGKECPARLTLKSKAKKAYKQIVGVERRDPSVLEWLDGNRFRLRVFPVLPENSRTVKVGITIPLTLSADDRLLYRKVEFEGPSAFRARENVHVDVFSNNDDFTLTGSHISLDEKNTSDGECRQFTAEGRFKKGWGLSVDAVPLAGSFVMGNELYRLDTISYIKQQFIPDVIYVLLSDRMSKAEWKTLIAGIYQHKSSGTKVKLVAMETFYTEELEKAFRFIEQTDFIRYHLFPLYTIDENKNALIITYSESYSIALSELKGGAFYTRSQEYFSKRTAPVYVLPLDNRLSAYFASFNEFDQIIPLFNVTGEDLPGMLDSGMVMVPDTDDRYNFPTAGYALEKVHLDEHMSTPGGNDLLARLYYYRQIMRDLGGRYFDKDADHQDLLTAANDAKVVTPLSSFVVLESEFDYQRFDIKDDPSKLGQSNIKKSTGTTSKLGMVPEPGEWAFMIMCLLVVIILYFKYFKRYIIRWSKR